MTDRSELIAELKQYRCGTGTPANPFVPDQLTAAAAQALRDDQDTIAAGDATIAELRDVVIAAIAYKESLLQTISSRPQGEQGKPMQGRMIMRQAFIAACEKYEGGDA